MTVTDVNTIARDRAERAGYCRECEHPECVAYRNRVRRPLLEHVEEGYDVEDHVSRLCAANPYM